MEQTLLVHASLNYTDTSTSLYTATVLALTNVAYDSDNERINAAPCTASTSSFVE